MSEPASSAQKRATYLRGLRDAIDLPVLLLMATMTSVGGIVRDVGFPAWAGTLSTLTIWAAPAQVILFGAVGAGASLPATAFAVCLSSARFLPMTVAILPLIRQPGPLRPLTLLAAHLVSMTTWVEGLRRLPDVPLALRPAYFFGYASLVIGAGSIATHVGYYIYGEVPLVVAAMLLYTTPMFFSSAMVSAARSRADWLALLFGFLITPLVMQVVPAGFDFLFIGVVGGTLAFLVFRQDRARARP